jgi:hypothetical protein
MKSIACLLAALFAATLSAQEFEGTVTWKMQAEIADPALQAKLQSAQPRMASPEMQAKMQEAQAAMQNPEMQAMLAQNPQMRAMIERQMGAMKGPAAAAGEGGGGLFPRGFTLKTKGARVLVTVDGGMFPSEVLSQADLGAVFQLNRAQQTYRRLPAERPAADGTAAHKITRTAETAKILGYTCTRCMVESLRGPDKAAYSVWVTKEIKGLDPKRLKNLRVGREQGPNFMDQLDGIPMKMEVTTPEGRLTMEVASIKAETLPAGLFEVPAEFTESGE